MLLNNIRDLLPKLAERDHEGAESYPAANLADLRAIGLPIAPFAKDLGGFDLPLEDCVRAIELVASASGSTALVLSMPLGLAGMWATPVAAIPEVHGERWRRQQEWAAAEYRAGKLFAACNSERGAGGSLDATKTVARADGMAFRLTGEKILASGGLNAHYFFSTAQVDRADMPGAGVVEFFLVPAASAGVNVLDDWDGFGMRSTESHTVRYEEALAHDYLGFPDFINVVQPLQYSFCLFTAIPLGCVKGMLDTMTTPAPTSPALRLRAIRAPELPAGSVTWSSAAAWTTRAVPSTSWIDVAPPVSETRVVMDE